MRRSAIGVAFLAAVLGCTEQPTGVPGGAEMPIRNAAVSATASTFHEPSGATTILDSHGDKYYGYSATSPGPWSFSAEWKDNNRVGVVNDAAAPYGTAVEKRFLASDASGWHGVGIREFGAFRQAYFRMSFMLSANWQTHPLGQKVLYWGPSGSTNRFSIVVDANQRLGFTAVIPSTQSPGTAAGSYRSSATVSYGVYHTLEVDVIGQSAAGSADGAVRVWLDGNYIADWRQGDRAPGELIGKQWYASTANPGLLPTAGIQQALEWGTSGAAKSVNDSFRQGELVIEVTSSATPPSGSSSGGGTTPPLPPPPGAVAVTVNPAVRYQTMLGWEGTAQVGQAECPAVTFNLYKNEVYDRVVNELGINRLRLSVAAGSENPHDYFADFIAGRIALSGWNTTMYNIVNDNTDPNTINPAGFHFSALDHTIDNVVLPIKQRLAARGEKLYVNLNYVDFGSSTFEHKSAPPEYGEFILAAFQHIKAKYGWVPDAVEVVLEPDNGNWTPSQIANALVAAGNRLKAAGFTPDFIVPSNKNMTSALTYFDKIMTTPGASQYVKELAYHRYGGVYPSTLQSIGARTKQYGVRSAMLEHIGATYQELHEDLKVGMNSAWQQYTLAYCSMLNNGGRYYNIDTRNVSAPKVVMGNNTKFLRQYFLFVRSGAVRIDATSGNASYDPLAFTNTNGITVVIIKAAAAGTFAVKGLPAGTYGAKYTMTSAYNVDQPDVTISAGQALTASIPGTGVLTLYAR